MRVLAFLFTHAAVSQQLCADGSDSCSAKPRVGAAMLQTDTSHLQQAHTDGSPHVAASLLEGKGTAGTSAESKAKASAKLAGQPLLGKVDYLATEVKTLKSKIQKLEKTIGITPASAGAEGAASAPEGEDAAAEEAGPVGLSTLPAKAPAAPRVSSKSRDAAKPHVKSHDNTVMEDTEGDFDEEAMLEGMALLDSSPHRRYVRASTLKVRVGSMEATVSDLLSRTDGLENEVLGRTGAVPVPKVGNPTALKSRIMLLEDKVDNIKGRVFALAQEVDTPAAGSAGAAASTAAPAAAEAEAAAAASS